MKMKDETLMAVGMLSLTVSLALHVFFEFSYMGFSVSDFLEGVLIGLFLTKNLGYLVRRRMAQRSKARGSMQDDGFGVVI